MAISSGSSRKLIHVVLSLYAHKEIFEINITANVEGRKVEIKVGLKRQMPYPFTYMWNLKHKQTNKSKQNQSHRNRHQRVEVEG